MMQCSRCAKLPTAYGQFSIRAFRKDDKEHLAVYMGLSKDRPMHVRVHSQCLTGDTFKSLRCDCEGQLSQSLSKIADMGEGVIIYLGQEGRGIGLFNKINAYALQDMGRDTVDANLDLGFPPDKRDYSIAAEILKELGVSRARVMTNNMEKIRGLEEAGISVVERIPISGPVNDHNRAYLETKKSRMNHIL